MHSVKVKPSMPAVQVTDAHLLLHVTS